MARVGKGGTLLPPKTSRPTLSRPSANFSTKPRAAARMAVMAPLMEEGPVQHQDHVDVPARGHAAGLDRGRAEPQNPHEVGGSVHSGVRADGPGSVGALRHGHGEDAPVVYRWPFGKLALSVAVAWALPAWEPGPCRG